MFKYIKRLFNDMRDKFEEGQAVLINHPSSRKYTHSMEPCIGIIEEVAKNKIVVNCGDMPRISEVTVTIVDEPEALIVIEDKNIADLCRKRIWEPEGKIGPVLLSDIKKELDEKMLEMDVVD